MQALREGERTVGELVAATGSPTANVSKHLQLLHNAGFLTRRKDFPDGAGPELVCYRQLRQPSFDGLFGEQCADAVWHG